MRNSQGELLVFVVIFTNLDGSVICFIFKKDTFAQ